MTRCSFLIFAAGLTGVMGCQLIGGFEDHELQGASTTTSSQGGSGGENTGGAATAGGGQGGGAVGPGGDGGTGNIVTRPECGDGDIGGDEVCDDGNQTSGDGCSAECTVECVDRNVARNSYVLHPDTNHCYRFESSAVSWHTAHDVCAGWGGTLAVVTSEEENEFITESLPIESTNWIGAHDLDEDGTYLWDNGEPVDYHSFDGIDIGKCSVMRDDLSWYTYDCDFGGKPFVCERSVGLP